MEVQNIGCMQQSSEHHTQILDNNCYMYTSFWAVNHQQYNYLEKTYIIWPWKSLLLSEQNGLYLWDLRVAPRICCHKQANYSTSLIIIAFYVMKIIQTTEVLLLTALWSTIIFSNTVCGNFFTVFSVPQSHTNSHLNDEIDRVN